MTYRPPRPGERRHEQQDTGGSNQFQMRIRCTRCNCHLAVVWVPQLNAASRRILIEMLEEGISRPQGRPAPRGQRTERWERRRRPTASRLASGSEEERQPTTPPTHTERAAVQPPPRPRLDATGEPDAEPQAPRREVSPERYYSPRRDLEERR